MRPLSSKEIVLGVTGSIAAYKACEIASRLVEYGARVTPALTPSAAKLVAPGTFEALTGRRAVVEMFEPLSTPEIDHIAVASRADLFIIAPATANIIAKAAHGIADNWLSTTLLATQAPILFAPAMNANMYAHPATQENIATLRGRGCRFVGPGTGRLACGAEGEGRMIAPSIVLEAAAVLASDKKDFAGRRVVITSGPTHEPIDPVRFIGNRSSGRMGRALAFEALVRGAEVTVVTGPTDVPLPHGAEIIRVQTAREMADAVEATAPGADVIIGAAAVADYRAEHAADTKHKRSGDPLTLRLVENPDIIAQVGASKGPGQVVVAFAAETDDLLANAESKMRRKQVDLIVANEVGGSESGFGARDLRCAILSPDDPAEELGLIAKEAVAERLFNRIARLLNR